VVLNINSVHHESLLAELSLFFYGIESDNLVKYFETSTTIPFPTVCPANEVPAVLE
jgi:hypothetical protein